MADDFLERMKKATGYKEPSKPAGSGDDDSVARVLDDEFSKLGYSPVARLSILGDVGRENNWNRNIIFGGHSDPKNKKFNRGIISWQGDRVSNKEGTGLNDFLKKEGVYGKGDDDELRGMARFMDYEMKTKFKDVHERLQKAQKTYDASEALRQYIKYVPDGPYNSFDPEFRVKNNADWARKAKRLGLAQDGSAPATDKVLDFNAEMERLFGKNLDKGGTSPGPNVPGDPKRLNPDVDEKLLPVDPAFVPRVPKDGEFYYDFEKTGRIGKDLVYAGNQDGVHIAKNRDGDIFKLDEDAKQWTPTGPQKRAFDTDKNEYTLSANQEGVGEGEVRRESNGNTFIFSSDGKIRNETAEGVLSLLEAKTAPVTPFPADGRLKRYYETERKNRGLKDTEELRQKFIKAEPKLKAGMLDTVFSPAEDAILTTVQNQGADPTTIKQVAQDGDMPGSSPIPQAGKGEYGLFVAEVDPEAEPGRDGNETAFRQAAIQAGRAMYGRDLTPLEVDALTEYQRQTRKGFAFSRNDNTPATAHKGLYFIDGAVQAEYKAFLDSKQHDIANEMWDRLSNFLAQGGTLDGDARAEFVKLGFDPEQLDQALGYNPSDSTVGETPFTQGVAQKKQQFQNFVQQYLNDPDPDVRNKALPAARFEMGWITPDQLVEELKAYDDLKKEKWAEINRPTPADPFAGTSGRSMAMAGGIEPFSDRHKQDLLQRYLTQTITKYGSAGNRLKALKQEEIAETARQSRIAQMSWPEYLGRTIVDGTLNLHKSAISIAISSTLRGIALGSKFLDDLPAPLRLYWNPFSLLDSQEYRDTPASKRWTYRAGEGLDAILEQVLPTNKDMQQEFLAGKLPQGIGSTIGMIPGGLSKLPKLGISILSSLQMGGDAYKDALNDGATEQQAQLAGMLQAPLGITEIVGMGNILGRLNKGTSAGLWRRLWGESWRAGAREIPEEISQEGFQQTAGNIIKRLTYDPDRRWDKDVFDSMVVAGIAAPIASAGITALNFARNRMAIKRMIDQEQAAGVIFQHYGEGELYAFGKPVQVTPELEPLLARHDFIREQITGLQDQIGEIEKSVRGKSFAEKREAIKQIWDLKANINALRGLQSENSQNMLDQAGIEPPEGTIGDAIIPTPEEIQAEVMAPSPESITGPTGNITEIESEKNPDMTGAVPIENYEENPEAASQSPQVAATPLVSDQQPEKPVTVPVKKSSASSGTSGKQGKPTVKTNEAAAPNQPQPIMPKALPLEQQKKPAVTGEPPSGDAPLVSSAPVPAPKARTGTNASGSTWTEVVKTKDDGSTKTTYDTFRPDGRKVTVGRRQFTKDELLKEFPLLPEYREDFEEYIEKYGDEILVREIREAADGRGGITLTVGGKEKYIDLTLELAFDRNQKPSAPVSETTQAPGGTSTAQPNAAEPKKRGQKEAKRPIEEIRAEVADALVELRGFSREQAESYGRAQMSEAGYREFHKDLLTQLEESRKAKTASQPRGPITAKGLESDKAGGPATSPDIVRFDDSLDIRRSEMPQISRTDTPDFLAFAKEKGVEITEEHVPISRLKPTQNEYNRKQAAQLPEEALKKPLLISQDYRVLDGHNIYARISTGNLKGKGVDVRVIHLDAAEALELMKSFPKTTYKPVEHVGTAAKLAEHQATNPIDVNASQEEKARQLIALTEANKPIVEGIVKRFRDELGLSHTELGKNNYKDFDKILEKANRAEVRAKKPWHDVEHIRDAFRFRAGFTTFDQIPQMAQIILDAGVEIQKVDTDKFLEPAGWGWRPVALDLRMPNGQLVEFYTTFSQMIDAQYSTSADHPVNNHDLYENWRVRDGDYIREHLDEFEKDRQESVEVYDRAYQEGLDVAGLEGEQAVSASFNKAVAALGSVTDLSSSISAPDKAASDQAPSGDLTNDRRGGSETTNATGEPSLETAANINAPSKESVTQNDEVEPKTLSAAEKKRIAEIDKELLGLSGAFTAMSDAGFGAGEVMAEMKKLRLEKDAILGKATPQEPDFAGTVNTDAITPENIDQIEAMFDKKPETEEFQLVYERPYETPEFRKIEAAIQQFKDAGLQVGLIPAHRIAQLQGGPVGMARSEAIKQFIELSDKITGEQDIAGPTQEPSNSDIFDDLLTEAFGEEDAKAAIKSHIETAKAESLKGLEEAAKGLKDLFGSDKFKSAGFPAFDDAMYAKAKPHFIAAFSHFKAAGNSVRDILKTVIDYMKAQGMDAAGLLNMKPYILRFADDVEAGEITLPESTIGSIKEEGQEDATQGQSEGNDLDSDAVDGAEDVQGTDGSGDAGSGNRRPGNGGTRNPRGTKTEGVPPSSDESGSDTGADTDAHDGEQAGGTDSDTASDGVSDGRVDYIAPKGSLRREGSWQQAAKTNLDIIELVNTLDAEGRFATPEEQKLIAKYTGWGATELANNVFGWSRTPGWEDIKTRAKELLTEDEWRTASRSTQYAHYTAEPIIRGIWSAIQQFGFQHGTILEPGMGIGLFPSASPDGMLAKSKYTGIEMDKMTARIAKHLLPRQAVIENDYSKQSVPKDYFDIAVGNPPFADVKILDDQEYKKHKFLLHDYFFAKTIDRVRPGGLMVFVTSKGTLDKLDSKARKYLADRADLLGAIRLPQTAFLENAGTEVVTDVIFLRKRIDGETPGGEAWLENRDIEVEYEDKYYHGKQSKTFHINEYYDAHPEMVLGTHSAAGTMYGPGQYTVEPFEGKDIGEQFAEAVKNLPKAVYAQQGKSSEIVKEAHERDFNPKAKKEGSLYIHDDGTLMVREMGAGLEIASKERLSANDVKWLKDYTGLRDALKQARYDQLHAEDGDVESAATDDRPAVGNWEESLKTLNEVYDAFVKKHGNILEYTDRESKKKDADGNEITVETRIYKRDRLLSFDVESPLVHSLESINDLGEIVKSNVLKERQVKPPEEPEIKTLSDALMVSLDRTGTLNIGHIAELMAPVAAMTEDQVIEELGDAIYEHPTQGWQMADEYLSGYVIDKLEEAETLAQSDPRFERNVQALKRVQPKPLPAAQITVALGAAWLTPDVIEQYQTEWLHLNGGVTFDALTNEWHIERAHGAGSQSYRDVSQEWGTEDRSPYELFEDALNNRVADIVIRDDDGAKIDDISKEATAAANEKIRAMRQQFKHWLFVDQERAQTLVAKYNRLFNNIAERQFDGSHLTLPGLSSGYKLYKHQLRAVWRILQSGNTYLNHAVGAGKAQPLNAGLLTPAGFVPMGQAYVGMPIIAGDGTVSEITGVYPQGEKDIFRVTFSDGSSTECCDEHLWLTQTYRERSAGQRAARLGKDWPSGHGKVRELSEIRRTLTSPHLNAKNHSIPIVDSVQFIHQEVPLDAYLLGVMLGDGCMSADHASLTCNDPQIVELCEAVLPDNTRFNQKVGAKADTFTVSRSVPRGYGADMQANGVVHTFRSLGLQGLKSVDKFVPDIYKINSADIRLAVLQGLLDTDGSAAKNGTVYFYSISRRLVDDVRFIVHSLGGTVSVKTKKPKYTHMGETRYGQLCYIVSIKLPNEIRPFRLQRKADRVQPKSKYLPARYIVSVDRIGRKEAQCISIAHPSKLYVTDDFIVTHNTLEMIVSGMEQKRLGLIRKPMYVVPNHMLKQFASEFLDAYPTANIMVADERNFHKETRKRFVARAALNDLDAVIVTHSAFGLLRSKEESVKAVVDGLLSDLWAEIEELTTGFDSNGNRRGEDRKATRKIKQLENRIEKIERRFYSRLGGTRDNVVDFEEMGVDFLYVDEAHEFRKLDFVTHRDQLKGITPAGSLAALDLLVKMRWLDSQRPGRSGVLASGTPIVNTLAEIYSIQRFLAPKALEEAGLAHFDAWANQFGEDVTALEKNAAGNWEMVERFARFVNMPELMSRVRQFMDVLTLNQLGDHVKLPKVRGGRPNMVITQPTEELTTYLKTTIANRIEESRAWKPTEEEPNNPDPIIAIISDARLAVIDMRFVTSAIRVNGVTFASVQSQEEQDARSDPNSKLNVMIDNIVATYNRDKDIEYIDHKTGEPDPIKGSCQIVFSAWGLGDQAAKSRGFDAKRWIIKRLVQEGVPPNEIAFISDYKTSSAKEALMRDVRKGVKKILVGTPKNMGTGLNVQRRLRALHFLSPPWFPSDVEQPHGRLIRQGNLNDEVDIDWYATEDTYDSTQWGMVARKSAMIDQAFRGGDVRSVEDISETSAYALAAALSAGDDRVVQLVTIEGEIERLNRMKRQHESEQDRIWYEKRQAEADIQGGKEVVANLETIRDRIGNQGYVAAEDFTVTVGGNEIAIGKDVNRADIGKAVLEEWKKSLKRLRKTIIDGKFMYATEDDFAQVQGKFALATTAQSQLSGAVSTSLRLLFDKDQRVSVTEPVMDLEMVDAAGLATRIFNALNSIPKEIQEKNGQIKERTDKLDRLNAKYGEPFPQETELYENISKAAELRLELAGSGTAAPTTEGFNLQEFLASIDQAALSALSSVPDVPRFDLRQALESMPPVPATIIGHNLNAISEFDDADVIGPPAGDPLSRKLDTSEMNESDRMTAEKMFELANAPLETVIDETQFDQNGDRIFLSPGSHELMRRTLEQVRFEEGSLNLKEAEDAEDLFKGQFIPPRRVAAMVRVLREKAQEALQKGYGTKIRDAFTKHADALHAASKNNRTVILYVFPEAIPEELFHQADYLGAADKNILNRHTALAKDKLDKHRVRTVLWEKHFAKFKEYRRQDERLRNATLRAEIPPFLLSLSESQLSALGITPDERADYLLTWFEGYAEKNGIESLNNFDGDQINVQTFIARVKAAQTNQDAQSRGPHGGNTEQQNTESGTAPPKDKGSDRQSNESEQYGRDAGEFFGLNEGEKWASLPATLRRAGIDIDDLAYDVFGDRAAGEEAIKLINEHGIEGTIKLLDNVGQLDVHHAMASFMIQRMLMNRAAELDATDPQEAENLRAYGRQVGAKHVLNSIAAGRFTRAASVIPHSVEGVVYSFNALINDKTGGERTISPEKWIEIEALGRELEEKDAKLQAAIAEQSRQKRKIKRLEDELEGKGKKKRRSRGSVKNRKQLVAKVKEEKQANVDKVRARLKARFGDPASGEISLKDDGDNGFLFVRRSSGEDFSLKSALEDETDFPIDDFAEVGAMMLTEGIAGDVPYLPEDFKAEMQAEFGDAILPYFQEIYKAAWEKRDEWLREIRKEDQAESIRSKYGEDLEDWEVDEIIGQNKERAAKRRAIENIHKLSSEGKAPKVGIDDMRRIIANLAPNAASAIIATVIAEGGGITDIASAFDRLGVEDGAKRREIMRTANDVFEKAKAERQKEKVDLANEVLQAKGELKQIEDLRWTARNEVRKTQQKIADEMRHIRNGELSYRWGQLVDASQAMRTMMASFDFSGGLRQGGFFTFAKPEAQAKAFADMFKSVSETGYGQVITGIEEHPLFVMMQRAGIDFAMAGRSEAKYDLMGEELFRGEQSIEKIPLLGKLLAEGIVKPSERTYTAVLDSQRAIMANIFFQDLMSQGLTMRDNPAEFRKVADFINIATGRGTLPGIKFAKVLMALPLFAPRYTLSRLQLLNMTLNPVAYYNMPPAARKIVAKSAARFYGTTGAILGAISAFGYLVGASVNWDDDDSDFLKIKIGNTHYDIFAGTLQPAKLIIKIVHSAIRTKFGTDNRVPGEFFWDAWNAVGRFLRGKLSPLASLTVDALVGEDYVGNKFELWGDTWYKPGKAIYSRLMPLTIGDAIEAYKVDGLVGIAKSTPAAVFGLGVSTYKPRAEQPETEAEKLAAKMKSWGFRDDEDPDAADTSEQYKLKSELIARARRGEDISADLADAKEKGLIDSDAAKSILARAKKTLLEDKAGGLTLWKMAKVLEVANPQEREELLPLVNKKMKNADVDNKLDPALRKKVEALGGRILGDFPMPQEVKAEFDRFKIKTPDVGENLTLKKNEESTKLSNAQYDKYRRESLEEIYTRVQRVIESPIYKESDPDKQERMIRKAISKARALESKETKQELREAVR